MGVAGVDSRLWGKQAGLVRPYPLVCHLLDTAAVAGALWDVWFDGCSGERAADEVQVPPRELRALVSCWAGLHDIGKISPPFQAKVPELYQVLLAQEQGYGPAGVSDEARRLHHSEATHWVLPEILSERGYPVGRSARRHVGHQVAQMLGGHHGRFWESLRRGELAAPRVHCPALGVESAWGEQCRAHVEVVQRVTGAGVLESRMPPGFAVVFSGLVVVADWLASQEEFIVARLPGEGWSAGEGELEEHWERAVAGARDVVGAAGLGRARLSTAPSFVDRYGFEPNALQGSLRRELPGLVGEGRGAGLLLVTAPAGEGKTEAALESAALLAAVSGSSGVGFSLPTMATADAMYERVDAFARGALQDDAALTRVHSMSWLARASAADAVSGAVGADRVVSGEAARVEAAAWLRGGRRGLLAPLSVFTIDQGLSAVLPVRYNVLRLLALSGKVLVVDEAHAYGPWMHALLVRLLEWLGALRAPVVLLSATLTGRAARSLMAAYLRGCGNGSVDGAALPELHYPGWAWVDAEGGVGRPRAVASERVHGLRFCLVPVRGDVDAEGPGNRLWEIKRRLQVVVEGGGCVLVCCTTVAEAQSTWRALRGWFADMEAEAGGPLPELLLLHSRFRARDRAEITDRCEAAFGKRGQRPRRGAVLVATQIVEQSLDLDFDLVITDLAPVAQLIQRAGRCQRHRLQRGAVDPHAAVRPAWLSDVTQERCVEVVVLDPVGPAGVAPRSWGGVYGEALLLRTSELLRARAGEVCRVPGDVQEFVDAVYADDFASVAALDEAGERRLAAADAEWLAGEAAEEQLASMVRVPAPWDLGGDLHRLSASSVPVDERLVATRLGADSARVVCAYEQAGRVWTLDEEGRVPVPGVAVAGGRLSRSEARLVADHVVPVPGGWLGEGAELLSLPAGWEENAVLRGWVLLPMRREGRGCWRGRLRRGPVVYGEAGLALVDDAAFG